MGVAKVYKRAAAQACRYWWSGGLFTFVGIVVPAEDKLLMI